MRRIAIVLIWLLVILAFAAAGFWAFTREPEIAVIDPPLAATFDAGLVQRGAALAAIGNCATCHSAPDGASYAGGVGIETPFGTIYSTNITPDPDTGIGRWPEEAFQRAMRKGVDRAGRHLYPAFPYDHFTLVTDGDNHAIYAFLMTRLAVNATPPANRLPFPLTIRPVIAAWKKLYLHEGPYAADGSKSAELNRGAYLVEGLGHCGACHTPRNMLGAEKRDQPYAGGEAEGWHAYAINGASAAPIPWNAESLERFLRGGWHPQHGVSRGPMAPVTDELQAVPQEDVRAIAGYVAALIGTPDEPRRARAAALLEKPSFAAPNPDSEAATTYDAACLRCHDGQRPLPFGGIALSLSIGVSGEEPRNLVNVVLYGLPAAEGDTGPAMPGFAGAMSDKQVADLAIWLRATFTDKAPWKDVEKAVREARSAGPRIARYAPGGRGVDPAASEPRRP